MPEVKTTTEWRCPNVRRHVAQHGQIRGDLPVPCAECYTVEIIETPMPLDLRTIDAHRHWIRWDPELTNAQSG